MLSEKAVKQKPIIGRAWGIDYWTTIIAIHHENADVRNLVTSVTSLSRFMFKSSNRKGQRQFFQFTVSTIKIHHRLQCAADRTTYPLYPSSLAVLSLPLQVPLRETWFTTTASGANYLRVIDFFDSMSRTTMASDRESLLCVWRISEDTIDSEDSESRMYKLRSRRLLLVTPLSSSP